MSRTRDRIVDATIELHASVGPGRTSIAQIADRAGVQRHTVYRHFPSQEDLLAACSQRYWESNPWRPVSCWEGLQDAGALEAELAQLYAFYDRHQDVIYRSLRDAADEPDIEVGLRSYRGHLGEVHGALMASLRPSADRSGDTRVMLEHVLAFETWNQLVRGAGATNEQAARLMAAAVMTNRE